MNNRRVFYYKLCLTSFLMLGSGFVAIQGCTGEPHFVADRCADDPLYPYGRCADDDDAGADADAEPPECPGRCVPFPEGSDALLWSRWPDLLLPASTDDPDRSCPDDLTLQFVGYTELVAPPASCDICKCEKSEGTCTDLPTDIQIRAGSCNDPNATALPFGGPPGWDGSCTSANGITAGATCPEGSSTLCAQTVSVGALPGPTAEACAVTTHELPAFWKDTGWKERWISCRGNVDELRCGDSEACAPDRPLPWLQCVWRAGKHAQCPTNYQDGPRVLYPELAINDGRECTKCECGPPAGSACLATIRLFDDAACVSQFSEETIASYGGQCSNLYPPGKAVGAKAITDLHYAGGSCLASGGQPIGEATPDDAQAVTFCCYHPFD